MSNLETLLNTLADQGTIEGTDEIQQLLALAVSTDESNDEIEFSVGCEVWIDGMYKVGGFAKKGIEIVGTITNSTDKAIEVTGTPFLGGYEFTKWFPKSVLKLEEITEACGGGKLYEYKAAKWFSLK